MTRNSENPIAAKAAEICRSVIKRYSKNVPSGQNTSISLNRETLRLLTEGQCSRCYALFVDQVRFGCLVAEDLIRKLANNRVSGDITASCPEETPIPKDTQVISGRYGLTTFEGAEEYFRNKTNID